MKTSNTTNGYHRLRVGVAALGALATTLAGGAILADEPMPNACPVDGCEVEIVGVKGAGGELELTFQANFSPDVSKNHFHVWWGENFSVPQVSRNAETFHGVKQGKWHVTDDYPSYVTQGGASVGVRGDAKTLCVSAADRNHNIIDLETYDCVDVSGQL